MAPAWRAVASNHEPAGSSRLMIASLGHATPPTVVAGFASPAASAANSRIFAARYASNEPWRSRCSWLRLVKIAASYATPSTRSSARAWDVVSSTAASLPAATIAASVAWSSGAPGVVTWASWRSRASPTFVSTVPIRPVDTPAASSAATARNEVVVLPSVPVIPITPSRREGSPYHQPAAWARAGRAAVTTTCGSGVPGTARSTIAATAPASAAGLTYSVPSTWKPGTATNSVPSSTSRESSATPRTATSPSPADADRQVVAPRAAQEAGGVEPGEEPGERPRLGGLGRGDGRRDRRVAHRRPVAHRAVRPGVTRRSTRDSPRPSA